tara:strand:- start:1241 stop:2251 length:1011 start_codon:yes stop_codon:yes gene_type:complete
MSKKILITGSAGFIGFHLTKKLLELGHNVTGIDNLNNYYDVSLKESRLSFLDDLKKRKNQSGEYKFIKLDLCSPDLVDLFKENDFDIIINLAAQAGVRYSIRNPQSYISSNIVGFSNLIECCRRANVKHFIYASSSSVYGMNNKQPFSTRDKTDYPVSLYAATKKSNELIAYSYSHLYKIPSTGLRFFTVYGPFGRPDMAYFSFTKSIIENKQIDIFNSGKMKRDFTYIDDIVSGMVSLINSPPIENSFDSTYSTAPYKIYNIGNNNPVTLDRFINAIESSLGQKAKKNFLPMQPGDVPITYADISDLENDFNFKPSTSIEDGIDSFVRWYKEYNH